MRITCLHSSADNIPIFEAARPAGAALAHHVRSDLYYRAKSSLDAGTAAETNSYLNKLQAGSDAVLVTCSVLSPIVEAPALAADALLAEELEEKAAGKSVEVLYTNEPCGPAVIRLFSAMSAPASVRISLVSTAWASLEAGDMAAHDRLVADAVAKSTAEVIAVVQATMAPAAEADPRVIAVTAASLSRIAARVPRVA